MGSNPSTALEPTDTMFDIVSAVILLLVQLAGAAGLFVLLAFGRNDRFDAAPPVPLADAFDVVGFTAGIG